MPEEKKDNKDEKDEKNDKKDSEDSGAGAAADLAMKASPLGPFMMAASAMSSAVSAVGSAMKIKKVPEPDMEKFVMTMAEPSLKPVIEEKILAHSLFQPPEKDENPLGPTLDHPKSNQSVSNKTDYSCKQTMGGNGNGIVNLEKTQLKDIIAEKLDCKHIKEVIVKNFEKFIDTKVVYPHYHSVSQKTNNINTVSVFYRHGLSKIVSKIMDDIQKEPETLKFFLDEMMQNLESMEDEHLMEYIYGFDNQLIFELINDEKIKKLADENTNNKDKMCKLLVELYPESEFNTLMNDLVVNKQMTPEDMQKWRTVYNDFQLKENIKRDANRKEENALLEKIGVENALKIFGLKPDKKEIPNMYTEFVNENTKYEEKYGGKRKTIKRKSKLSKSK